MDNFSAVRKSDCRPKKIPAGVSLTADRTLILQSVINEIKEHGRSSMNREVCGVLVGDLCWDGSAYLMIDARIEGKFADHQAGSVTFTSQTWDFIHHELAEKYADRKIVGWYHTHPGFGIFLSNMDAFIHENFFSIKWQPAYVFDPQAETDGFFFWREANLEQGKVTVVPDVPAKDVKPAESPKGKISVVITEAEEKENERQRLRHALTVIFLIFCLGLVAASAGMIFHLYKQNQKLRERNQQLKETILEIKQTLHESQQRLERIEFEGNDHFNLCDQQIEQLSLEQDAQSWLYQCELAALRTDYEADIRKILSCLEEHSSGNGTEKAVVSSRDQLTPSQDRDQSAQDATEGPCFLNRAWNWLCHPSDWF